MPLKQLLKGGIVLSMDPDVGDFDSGDVLIEGEQILEVAQDIDPGEAEVIDASDMIVMPGLVDTHRALWYAPVRNVSCDLTLFPFMAANRGLMMDYKPDWVYAGELLGALDALNGGITSMKDWCHVTNTPAHADAAIKALTEVGARVCFVYATPAGWVPPSGQSGLPDDMARVKDEYFDGPGRLLSYGVGLRGPDLDGFDKAAEEIGLARELGVFVSWHIAGGKDNAYSIRRLAAAGLLGPDINHVHAMLATDDEFAAIAENGGSVTMCPSIAQVMGIGDPPIRRALINGVKPGLAVDGVVAGGGHIFDDMRAALIACRRQEAVEAWGAGGDYTDVDFTTREALELGTIAGARAIWLDDRIGSLTPGKDADVIMLRTSDLNMLPVTNVQDAVWAATCSANAGNVDSVWVAGKRVKKDGELTIDVDLERALALAVEARSTWNDGPLAR
jgi:5-methylthioadenosine/S-adenosylhomocysteine deaminase